MEARAPSVPIEPPKLAAIEPDFRVAGAGTKERKRPYVAHLSKTAFAEMKKRHRGAQLEKAIQQWIRGHDQKGGVE